MHVLDFFSIIKDFRINLKKEQKPKIERRFCSEYESYFKSSESPKNLVGRKVKIKFYTGHKCCKCNYC